MVQKTKKVLISNIKWDTDNEKVPHLPKTFEMEVDVDCDVGAEAADLLSEKFDYCVFSFDWEDIKDVEAATESPRG